MISALLIRGMLVGALAGVLSFGVAKILGEPQVDRAIAFEEQMPGAEAGHNHSDAATTAGTMNNMSMASGQAASAPQAEEDELVSRSTQAGLGLLTAVVVYGAAFGGLFAIVFAFVYRRLGQFSPRATAALLAAAAFITIYFIPSLKYPANPPSVGLSETIGHRTGLFVAMIAFSVAAMIVAVKAGQYFHSRYGTWNAALIGVVVFIVLALLAGLLLPPLNEVPEAFPAVVLWNFRIAASAIQAVMWGTLGLAFGLVAEPVLRERPALTSLAAR